jgi:dihydrofolate synthase/folylpolyglutamate synthase
MNFKESVDYLYGLGHETLSINFDLDNSIRLLEAVRQPHQKFLKIQIAGTNGKGSAAAMVDAILRAANIKTGLYTSPHLVSITERMRFDGHEIRRDEFARVATQVRDQAERLVAAGEMPKLPTIFEHLTVMFLLAAAESKVEIAILETGMGGRLDATTAARSEVAAITSIALDHEKYLGSTLAEIAAEKAAIVHSNSTVIVARQPAEVREVIGEYCAKHGVTPRVADYEVDVRSTDDRGRLVVTLPTDNDVYENVRLSLPGRHQVTNAAVAVGIAEALNEVHGMKISREAIIAGLENASHPGRLEWEIGERTLLFDGAHNTAGAWALREFLTEFVKSPVTLVFGAMGDKDISGMASALFPLATHLVLTGMENPRAASVEDLRETAELYQIPANISVARGGADALDVALRNTPADGLICVTGSLGLIGEVKTALRRARDKSDESYAA